MFQQMVRATWAISASGSDSCRRAFSTRVLIWSLAVPSGMFRQRTGRVHGRQCRSTDSLVIPEQDRKQAGIGRGRGG